MNCTRRAQQLLLLLGVIASPWTGDPLQAQTVEGRLLDDATGTPIENAIIEVLAGGDASPRASVLTGEGGRFRINDTPDAFRLRASRLGYRTAVSQLLSGGGDHQLNVEVRLSTEAVLLEPLTVVAEARPWWESIRPRRVWGLYERMERFGETGFARFITPEDLERMRGSPGWAILSSPFAFNMRLQVQSRGTLDRLVTIAGCPPVFFLDGLRYRAEEWVAYATVESLADQRRIEGIEFHIGGSMPYEFARYLRYEEKCVIAVWTRLPPN